MTNHTGSISYLQQMLFYIHKPANIDIYIACLGSNRVGYMLLRHEGATTFITEAVDEPYRRMGVGARLIRYAQQLYPDLTAEIRVGNTASLKLHHAEGFVLESANGIAQTYRFTRSGHRAPR